MGEGMVCGMTTAVLTFICILIALALFAGAFYLAKYVVSLQHRVVVLEDSYKQATEHIEKQDEALAAYQQQIDYMERNEAIQKQAQDRPQRGWNPSDPLHGGTRQ